MAAFTSCTLILVPQTNTGVESASSGSAGSKSSPASEDGGKLSSADMGVEGVTVSRRLNRRRELEGVKEGGTSADGMAAAVRGKGGAR